MATSRPNRVDLLSALRSAWLEFLRIVSDAAIPVSHRYRAWEMANRLQELLSRNGVRH